jgi:hypothetical protein
MSPDVTDDATRVASCVNAYRANRAGQRGIDTYAWLVDLLGAQTGSRSSLVTVGSATGVVTSVAGSAVLHCLDGPAPEAASVIEHVRSMNPGVTVRGLALPGDRLTKNLFEEARMPAQLLVH